MSYINMDHAGWVERNIAASKKQKPTAAESRAARERHAGWYAAPDILNPFQRRAIDILGIVGNGIYNAPIAWQSVVWHRNYITVRWQNSLATWDFMGLTRLVFLCHEARIRAGVMGSMRALEIHLSERSHEGGISTRHPNLEEALLDHREEFLGRHPIRYLKPTVDVSAA